MNSRSQPSLSDYGIRGYTESECRKISNHVSRYPNQIKTAKSTALLISIVTFFVLIFSAETDDFSKRIIGSSMGFMFAYSIVYWLYTRNVGSKPSKKHKEIAENFDKYWREKQRIQKTNRERKKKVFDNYVLKEYQRISPIEQKINGLQKDIRKLKKKVQKREIKQLKELKELSSIEFENYISDLLEEKGYITTLTSATGDGGVDIILEKENQIKYVECKKYNGTVGSPELMRFLGTLKHNEVDHGIFITTGNYSEQARHISNKHNIKLIDGTELITQIKNVWGSDEKKQEFSEKLKNKKLQLRENFREILEVSRDASAHQIKNNYNQKLKDLKHDPKYVPLDISKKAHRIESFIKKSYQGL